MAEVDVCPQNLTMVNEQSRKLNCSNDQYGNSQYLCLSNEKKTSLVEFCYDGIMGIQEKGKLSTYFVTLSQKFLFSTVYPYYGPLVTSP